MSEPLSLNPCPHCKAPAKVSRDQDWFFIECSNQMDCNVWPETRWNETLEAAAEEWNKEIANP